MNTNLTYTPADIVRLDPEILASALNALQALAANGMEDIYTDAPECQESVARFQAQVHQADEVCEQIYAALSSADDPLRFDRDAWAQRILDEAEEAFAARSMAAERALLGGWPTPETVGDYLFWIEDEAGYQEMALRDDAQPAPEDRIYLNGLRDLGRELRSLSFEPSTAPWADATAG